jgi:hypothetical protein
MVIDVLANGRPFLGRPFLCVPNFPYGGKFNSVSLSQSLMVVFVYWAGP